jgi:hypothetical protein
MRPIGTPDKDSGPGLEIENYKEEIKLGTRMGLTSGRAGPNVAVAVKLVLITGALLLYFLPPSSVWIEKHYSTGFYPILQRAVTPVSNRVPFAINDILVTLLIVGLPVWWIVRMRSAGRGRRAATMGRLAFNTAALGAVVFMTFELVWGLNYLREPLTRKLDYDRARVTESAAVQLADLGAAELNALSTAAHRSAWPDLPQWSELLQPSFEAAVVDLGDPGGAALARAKKTIFDFYLSASGIDGFTNPFGMEVILHARLLPQEQPFSMAHEWAHLAGFADESEANFIALITCLRSEDLSVKYAGWLAAYPSLAYAAKVNADQRPNRPQLAPEVKADLAAMQRRRSEGIKPWISNAEWRIYDRFLRANGVQAGIESYDLFIQLALGTRFNPGWVPQLRSN